MSSRSPSPEPVPASSRWVMVYVQLSVFVTHCKFSRRTSKRTRTQTRKNVWVGPIDKKRKRANPGESGSVIPSKQPVHCLVPNCRPGQDPFTDRRSMRVHLRDRTADLHSTLSDEVYNKYLDASYVYKLKKVVVKNDTKGAAAAREAKKDERYLVQWFNDIDYYLTFCILVMPHQVQALPNVQPERGKKKIDIQFKCL